MKFTINYGDKPVTFKLIRKNVKHINLTVQPDQSIFVSANKSIEIEEVKTFVQSKGRWIESKLNYFNRHAPYEKIAREYVSGETFRYLGRQYKLKIIESDKEYVRYYRGTIEMYVKNKLAFKKKENLMEAWYEKRREIVFQESHRRMYELIKTYNIDLPTLETRKMHSRWGSYLSKGNKIILNKDLIIAPRYCIDYVVLHELIHVRYPDHDFNFFNQQQLLMPDWKERKRILDEEVAREI